MKSTKVIGGQDIVYTITIKNNGGTTAENVYVKDAVPEKTTFKSVPEENQGRYHGADNYVSWLIPSIEAGKEVSVSFTVTVNAPTDGSMIVNQAAYENEWELNQDGTPKEGEDPVNTTNIVEHPTPAPKPNLAAVKSSVPVSGTKVYSGNNIVYTITVTNVSETDAKDVYVRDYIPEYMRYVSVADDGSYNSESNYVSWNIGTIKAGESAGVSFTARVLSTAINKEVRNHALYEDNWNPENIDDPENRTNEVIHPVTTSGGGGGGGTTPTTPTDPTDSTNPTAPTNPAVNPPIVPPGHTVEPADPRTYVEYDENGIPLGTWHLDDDNIWVFDTEIPLGALARTGDSWIIERMLFSLAYLSMFGVVLVRRTKKRRDED